MSILIKTSTTCFLAVGLLLGTGCATTQRDWEEASRQGTVEAYEAFLKKYPSEPESEKARAALQSIQDDLAWKKASQLGTIGAYKEYLRLYPNGIHIQEAHSRMDVLAWQTARQEDTMDAYRKYLSTTDGKGAYTQEARSRLDVLVWETAQRTGTLEAYKTFLAENPKSEYRSEALNNIDRLTYESALQKHSILALARIIHDEANKAVGVASWVCPRP